VEIPIRFRRRVGESKGASRSLLKGLEVGMAMIWYIMTFKPAPRVQKPGVVVERDGIIIRHRDKGQPRGQFEFVPGAMEGLAALSRHGHNVIVVGDRSDHERTGISPRLARAMDARIAAEVEHRGGRVDAFGICTHRPGAGCSCRHPVPQLLVRAARKTSLDLSRAVVVSDRRQFLTAAAALGCETILVVNGTESNGGSAYPVQVLDLAGAVEMVLSARTGPIRGAIPKVHAIS